MLETFLLRKNCVVAVRGPHDVLYQHFPPVGDIHQPVLDVRVPHDLKRHVALQRVRDEDCDGKHNLDTLGQPEGNTRPLR
ncbi:hypothetical protein L798_02972 [Zootermopsis nevadensis]|uniref:Uncharacterized protein n=1 Tax=Zootermopsis nevadensis TaxID=136037 RepID=A0A067RCN1_ZOONE|nr:hypothetical protein L798_02972 [Zootermopsis nevadensis]